MVNGWILGCSCCDGEKTSRFKNETHLEAAGLPGRAAAGVAMAQQSAAASAAARRGVHGHARLEAAHGSQTWRVKARGPRQRMA
jgi:hypothetical protein